MSKPLFSIIEGTGEDPFKTVKLDEESRKYVHVVLNNVVKTYDKDGTMDK